MSRPDQVRPNPALTIPTAERGEHVIIRPQPIRPAMVARRPPSSLASALGSIHGMPVAVKLSVDELSQRILCQMFGGGAGSAPNACTLYHHASLTRDCQRLMLDAELQRALFGDGVIDRWAEGIRRHHEDVVVEGAEAYARAVMQSVFAGVEPGQSPLPPALERVCATLDKLMLEMGLDVGLDLATLGNLCSQTCVRFLCNTVLLPRLLADAAGSTQASPLAAEIEYQLAKAFDTSSLAMRRRWAEGSERALIPARADKLRRLFRDAAFQNWLDAHQRMVDTLGRLRPEFVAVAKTCLTARFPNESFVLLCLLKIYQSYPLGLEWEVNQYRLRLAAEGGSRQDCAQLVHKQSMLTTQKGRWMADVQFIRYRLSDIAGLSEAGGQYLMHKLLQLAQAQHRPRVGALNLGQVLQRAMRQHDAIVEEYEVDQ